MQRWDGWLLGLLLVGLAVGEAGAAVSVGARLDRPVARVGEQLVLSLEVSGELRDIGEPRLPELDGFDVYGGGSSQQLQFVNGRVDATYTFTWYLRPTRAGQFTIEPLEVDVDGAPFRSPPLQVEVRPVGDSLPEDDAPARTDRSGNDDIFITLSADKDSVVVGEPVLLRFAFHRSSRSSLFESPQYSPPATEGFWREDLPPERNSSRVIDGRRYAVTEIRYALFPARAGQLEVGEATVRLPEDMFRGIFSRGRRRPPGDLVLRTEPFPIHVDPLPPGAPEGFAGTVGEGLELELQLDRDELRAGEALTLTLRLAGEGNLAAAAPPELPPIPGARVHDAGRSVQSRPAGDTLLGRLELQYLVIPDEAGELRLPTIEYPYYDSALGRYATLRAAPPLVTVLEGDVAPGLDRAGEDTPIVARDIRHLLPLPGGAATPAPGPWAWPLAALAPVAWAGSLLVARRRRGPGSSAATPALPAALARLEGGGAVADRVAGALRYYAAARTGGSAAALDLAEAVARLREGVGPGRAAELARLVEAVEAARFAGATEDPQLVERARELLHRLEEDRRA